MRKLILTSAMLCSSYIAADGFGIDLGPLNVGFGTNDGPYYNDDDYSSRYSYGYQRGYNQNGGFDGQQNGYDEVNGSNRGMYGRNRMNPMDVANQLCQAINSRSQVEIVMEKREIVNSKEARMETKRIVVEPYGLAVSRDGQPVVRGNVVSEKTIKEVTVKFDEDHFDTKQKDNEDKRSSSWFSSSTKNLNVTRVSSLNILNDKRFDAPSDYKGFDDNTLNVICEIQPVKK